MGEKVVTIGDVVYEIGNPTKFIVKKFDGHGVLLDAVFGDVRKFLGQWVGLRTLQRYFVWGGRWDYTEEREVMEDV
jgi:hypothetical protein